MGIIDIVSVGWTRDDLTLGAIDLLKGARHIVLKTARCGAAAWLSEQGLRYDAFDERYDDADDFDQLNKSIADDLIERAKDGDVLFVINDPGDSAAQALYAAAPDAVRLHGGPADDSALMGAEGSTVRRVSAGDIAGVALSSTEALIVTEIDSVLMAGEVKLRLSAYWPDEWPVLMRQQGQSIRSIPLYQLDRQGGYNHMTSIALKPVTDDRDLQRFTAGDLMRLMRHLRGFDGCPWDREQTHTTLRPYVIEEAYEVAEAIDKGDMDALCEELGDILYQIIFHACIGEEFGEFDLGDVMTALGKKIIRRHPHVFADAHCDTAEEVAHLWNQVKAQEKAAKSLSDKLDAVARTLPALMRAKKIMKALKSYGLENADVGAAPLSQLWTAVRDLVEMDIDPEEGLQHMLDALIDREKRMEALLSKEYSDLNTISHDELLRFWKEAEEI